VGEAGTPAMWAYPDSLEVLTEDQNSGIKMSQHENLKF
jgi:hypothetical protein